MYTGGTPLDDDFIYQDKLFPAGSAAIGGFFLPVTKVKIKDGNKTVDGLKMFQPDAVLFYNGQQYRVPLECTYFNGDKTTFDKKGLPGCLRIIPTITNGKISNMMGAALYLSRDVKDSLFSKLFLMNTKSKYFKLAYTDESRMPLAVYNGRLIGPLKIWTISYPDNLIIPKEYYGTTLPDKNVIKVKK